MYTNTYVLPLLIYTIVYIPSPNKIYHQTESKKYFTRAIARALHSYYIHSPRTGRVDMDAGHGPIIRVFLLLLLLPLCHGLMGVGGGLSALNAGPERALTLEPRPRKRAGGTDWKFWNEGRYRQLLVAGRC